MGNLDELVGAMKGEDTLSGWDVLVSYNEVQLNALLAERARTLNLTLPDPWETTYEDLVTGVSYTMVFDVKLLQPTLQFIDTTNSITLIMGLAGQYHVKDNAKMTDLPSGLTCELSTSLVNVAGEWHEEGWTPTLPKEGQQETQGDNFVVILEPGDSKARGICVDLKNCVATLSETPGANIPEGTKAMLNPLIAPFLRGHFAKHSYRLCLAALSNHFDVGEKDSELLQPEHFCFTVESGALLTWIGLKGGPNTGTRPSGKTSLSFSPGSSARSPIPDDSTASIIFSHNTMANLFLGHALRQSPDVKGVTCTSIRTNTGMNFSIDFTSHAVVIPPEDWSSGLGSGYHVDGCNIDLNENSCGLKIDGDARPGTTSQKPLSLSWSSNSKLIRANSYQPSPMPGKPGPTQRSSCHATFKYAGSGQWKGSTDPVKHPNQLGVQFELDKYLSMNIVPEKPNWWETYNGKTGDVPRKYQNLTPTAPSVNLSLKPLDYFLTTNLLLPGQHIFIADDPVQVSTGTQKGLATPRDTVLTGNVAVNTPASTRSVDAMRRHRELLGIATGSQSFSPLAAESTAATLNDMKEAFLAFPSNNLLGDLLKNTLGGGGKLPARDLLQQYGFGHLADENFLSLWGTSIEELLDTAPETATAAARSIPTPTQIDMRLYSGYYIISQPEDDSGEQFLIHPLTGAIRMRNKDIVPKQTYDTEARRVMVTWQSPGTGATYSAFFSLCVDQDTLALGTKCKGTVARSGDQSHPQPFEAFLRGYRPAPTWLNDSATSSLRPLEEGRDPAENANLYLGMIVAGISIVGNIVSIAVLCWKTAKSKKELAFKDKTINEQKSSIDKMADSIQAAVAKSLRQEYDNHAGARDLALKTLGELVDAAAQAQLDKILKSDPQALEGPSRQDHIDKLHEVAKDKLVEEAPSVLKGVTTLAIEAAMARNSFRSALPDGRSEKMLKDLQVQEVERAVKGLEDVPTPNSKAFSELSAQKVADVARAKGARLELEKLSQIRANAEKELNTQDAAAKKFEKEVVEEAKKKAEDPKATEAEKQAYKDAQDKLKDLKDKRDDQQKKHNEAQQNEKKADEHRKERESKAHESKERQEKKREHVL